MLRGPVTAIAGLVSGALTACTTPPARWYTPEQVAIGDTVFARECAECHGERAVGAPDWRRPLPDNTFPPPPLDGSAHAWHHSLDVLLATIDGGGAAMGGTMPGFAGRLTRDDQLAAVAYIQSLWPDSVYRRWRR